jgi:glucose-1-phosphate thymidylyltransferase
MSDERRAPGHAVPASPTPPPAPGGANTGGAGTGGASASGARPAQPLEFVGVIPGGGGATRLAPLPFSKELLPIGFRETSQGPRPKVIANYFIDSLRAAGVRRVFWLLDKQKADVIGYFGSGERFGVQLAYVPVEASPSVVHTLDRARDFLRDAHVLFGFPDIIFEPFDALARLSARLAAGGADVVLGAVPAPSEVIADRVELGAGGELLKIRVKPLDRGADPVWIVAAWSACFTDFLHTWLEQRSAAPASPSEGARELYIGHAIEAAREAGLSIAVETFPDGCFIDAGTPDGLVAALQRHGAIGDTISCTRM